MWEKLRQPTDCGKITMREEYSNGESTEATTSCTPSSPRGGYSGGNDLSLSLSLHSYALYTYNYKKMFNNPLTLCPKSYLYTYDFRPIYTYGPKGFTRAHLRMCPFQPGRGDHHRFLDHPVLLNFPSGGTCFPTNSPFTPAWDVV